MVEAMTRRQPRSAAVRAALLLASLALLAGCSNDPLSSPPESPTTSSTTPGATDPTSPTAQDSPTPPAAAPVTATCRELDYSAISHYSNTTATSPCNKRHTAYTFAVETIPPGVSVAGVSIGNKSIQDAASSACNTAFTRFIGGDPASRALSRLSVTYFLPEQHEFNAGAHWVRCDVVALKTANSLATLPDNLNGFLSNAKALDDFGVCSDGVPGASGSALVICSEPHTYRALAALRLGTETDPYPGVAVAGTEGQKRCSSYLADTLGDTGYTYGWTYPTAADWGTGQRFGYCWNLTKH